jgi:carbonic anhydrase
MKRLLVFFIAVLLISCHAGKPLHENRTDKDQSPLALLLEGNHRFQSGKSIHPHLTHQRLEDLSKGQHPVAVVISCSDSRVPPELVFDQGLGDLFVVRTAGNTLSEIELGSVEYAVEHLHVGLIVVMGHEQCGAVKAVVENSREEGELGILLSHLKEEPEVKEALSRKSAPLDEVVQANIQHVTAQIRSTPGVLSEKIKGGELTVVGTEYYFHNGAVKIFSK